MQSKQLIQQFIKHLTADLTSLRNLDLSALISENLFSPYVIRLPSQVLKDAQAFIKSCYALRERAEYSRKIENSISDPGNKSIMMSYDFHLSPEGLKLIEVNTNAAFWGMGYWMYKSQGIAQPIVDFAIQELKENILEEMRLAGFSEQTPKIAIVDEAPTSQRLYVEFLLYQALFHSWSFPTDILDIEEIKGNYNFIYNRSTDFYLSSDKAKKLKALYEAKNFCLSPNPHEYFLLADKNRLLDWGQERFLIECGLPDEEAGRILRHLPQTQLISSSNADQIWSQRKSWFFKPLQSFGAKQAYRGASISRKTFDGLVDQGFLAQALVPAPELELQTSEASTVLKYDLRFYAYKDRLQTVLARLYQGQVTNLKTPGGGFACVEFFD